MNIRTKVYLQVVLVGFVIQERDFTMSDLICGKHLPWLKEATNMEYDYVDVATHSTMIDYDAPNFKFER